jgi:hypothetical protein
VRAGTAIKDAEMPSMLDFGRLYPLTDFWINLENEADAWGARN